MNRIGCAEWAVCVLLTLGLPLALATRAAGQTDPSNVDLTGVWNCDDDATYHIRQVGKVVWWSGVSKRGEGASFTNVFRGVMEVNPKVKPGEPGHIRVKGEWADVRGKFRNSGTMTLEVVGLRDGVPVEFRRVEEFEAAGGFTGKTFKRDKK